MTVTLKLLALLGVALLSACASPSKFTHTWKDPDAKPLNFKGEKVVAAVLIKGEASRRLAEDRLAQQIAARGAQGRTMYSLLPGAVVGDEAATRAALEAAGIKGVIVMRPVSVDKEVSITQPTYYQPSYATYWGGYYGYGMSMSYGSTSTTVRETTVVYVETLVYSLEQNKLVWGGQSKTTNPDNLAGLVEDLAKAAVFQLQRHDLVKK